MANAGGGFTPQAIRAASMTQVAVLARDLVAARDIDSAVEAAVSFVARELNAPSAVYIADEPDTPAQLIGVWHVGDRLARAVGELAPTLPASAFVPEDLADELEAFKHTLGLSHAWVIGAETVTIFVGDVSPAFWEVLSAIGELLTETLQGIERHQGERDQLDLGLAVTAHELRAPLLGARAALELVLHGRGVLTPELGLLRRTAHELDGLAAEVDDLLRWSAGAEPLHLQRCDLSGIVREAVGRCTSEHGQDRVRTRARPVAVFADAAHLCTALSDLVRNALAYSPAASTVRVHVAEPTDGPTVTVRDEGPGVGADEQPRLFEPFHRGRGGRARPGHGLGLFIAKRIVDAHGGSLRYEPAPGGCGSVFRIQLPRPPIP